LDIFIELVDLLEMSNVNWHSPGSSSRDSLSLTPSVESTSSTPPAIDADYVTQQVHNIIFHQEENHAIKWEFLRTKAPFPVSKLVENKPIVELLLTTEPGPKVDYNGLGTNLALLKPFLINAPSGPALLGFFKSLIQIKAGWLLAAAKLEAFRCYDRTLFTYYIEWHEQFEQDTAARNLDDVEISYQEKCLEHASTRASGFFTIQEQQLLKEVEVESMKLINFKTSQEMWKNSRILWHIIEQYQRFQQKKKAAVQQTNLPDEKMNKRKTEEILQRRAEVKKKSEEAMQQQEANNLIMQQDWMSNYPPGP
jgi:hypothetical protein